jgi:hypothetical protein
MARSGHWPDSSQLRPLVEGLARSRRGLPFPNGSRFACQDYLTAIDPQFRSQLVTGSVPRIGSDERPRTEVRKPELELAPVAGPSPSRHRNNIPDASPQFGIVRGLLEFQASVAAPVSRRLAG